MEAPPLSAERNRLDLRTRAAGPPTASPQPDVTTQSALRPSFSSVYRPGSADHPPTLREFRRVAVGEGALEALTRRHLSLGLREMDKNYGQVLRSPRSPTILYHIFIKKSREKCVYTYRHRRRHATTHLRPSFYDRREKGRGFLTAKGAKNAENGKGREQQQQDRHPTTRSSNSGYGRSEKDKGFSSAKLWPLAPLELTGPS